VIGAGARGLEPGPPDRTIARDHEPRWLYSARVRL